MDNYNDDKQNINSRISDVKNRIIKATSAKSHELKERIVGVASTKTHELQNKAGEVKDKVDQYVKANPWKTIGYSTVAGVVLAKLLGIFKKK